MAFDFEQGIRNEAWGVKYPARELADILTQASAIVETELPADDRRRRYAAEYLASALGIVNARVGESPEAEMIYLEPKFLAGTEMRGRYGDLLLGTARNFEPDFDPEEAYWAGLAVEAVHRVVEEQILGPAETT